MSNEKRSVFMKQPVMMSVVYALLPLTIASVYFFGWRSVAVLAVVNVSAFVPEYIFSRVYGRKVSQAVFVSAFLYALSMPPTIPFWIASVGMVFGIVFGKMVFGGFGKNIFNPAIAGRAFVYASFGYHLTSRFVEPVGRFPGGFAVWQGGVDALTKATPLLNMKEGASVHLSELFFGNVAGSLGETSAVLIILAGIWLMYKKTASVHIVVPALGGFMLFQSLFYLTGLTGTAGVPAPLYALLSGSVLFGIMFMATDPVSASQTTNPGRWIYGAVIGILTCLIRTFSSWPEGVTFAILFANMFAPLINYLLTEGAGKKARSAKGSST